MVNLDESLRQTGCSNSRVLLTGATGFVGHAIHKALVAEGIPVTCVIRTGSKNRLYAQYERVITTDDLFEESTDWWSKICSGIDMVIHAAWYAEPGKYLTSEKNMACLIGTMALAQGCTKAGIRRFVGIGTCFEYDTSYGYLAPDTRLAPTTPYAAAKAATYTMLNEWLPQMGVSFLWARLFYLYGERENAQRLIPYLHQQLGSGEVAKLTSGNQLRDYMDVVDASQMLLKEARNERSGAINICSGIPITIRKLAENIADQYGRRDLLRFDARESNLIDPPVIVGLRCKEQE